MVNTEELKELCPISYNKFEEFMIINYSGIIEEISVSLLIVFLDRHELFIGIGPNEDGSDWYADINAIHVDICATREEAENVAIKEAFIILEKLLTI